MNIKNVIKHESFAGFLLMFSLVVAAIISNSFLYKHYLELVNLPILFSVGNFVTKVTLIKLVNDGLMALFFLLVGLELKYQLIQGVYINQKKLILPISAASGGFIVPALIYTYFNIGSPTIDGWAIPVATDTAFVLGLLSFFGRKISLDLRVFVIGFSLFDDVLAIIVLAVFYTHAINFSALFISVLLTLVLFAMNYKKVTRLFWYLVMGLLLWVAIVEAGIHGTLAGIILALFIPVKGKYNEHSPVQRLERGLHPLVNYGILPIFAFINSEIPLAEMQLNYLFSNLGIGIILGLFIGKQLGICLFSYVMIRLGYCFLPENTSWPKYYAISVLAGIGFTLSLFIGSIAFQEGYFVETLKISILIGSFLSALLGIILLRYVA